MRSWPPKPSQKAPYFDFTKPCSRCDDGLTTCARRVLLSFRVLLIICWVVSRWVSSWPNCMATEGQTDGERASKRRTCSLVFAPILTADWDKSNHKRDKILFCRVFTCFHLCKRIKREMNQLMAERDRLAQSLNNNRLLGYFIDIILFNVLNNKKRR